MEERRLKRERMKWRSRYKWMEVRITQKNVCLKEGKEVKRKKRSRSMQEQLIDE